MNLPPHNLCGGLLGLYVVRFPMGGYLSWVLQWIVGLQRLGHELYFVEKAGWANACFDPSSGTMSDDCAYGLGIFNDMLARFGLHGRRGFVDIQQRPHGLSREQIEAIFKSADLF